MKHNKHAFRILLLMTGILVCIVLISLVVEKFFHKKSDEKSYYYWIENGRIFKRNDPS